MIPAGVSFGCCLNIDSIRAGREETGMQSYLR